VGQQANDRRTCFSACVCVCVHAFVYLHKCDMCVQLCICIIVRCV